MNWHKQFTQSPNGMLESNGSACCILGICCNEADALASLSADLQAHAGLPAAAADTVAAHLMTNYDLAPAGTLAPLKQAIVAHAGKHFAHHPPTV